jgi:hypothetical protein
MVCPSVVISLEKQLRVGDLEREGEMGLIVPKIILASVRIVCSKVRVKMRGRSTGNCVLC